MTTGPCHALPRVVVRLTFESPSTRLGGKQQHPGSTHLREKLSMGEHRQEPPTTSGRGLKRERLDSWKEIASYLYRDVRTVIL